MERAAVLQVLRDKAAELLELEPDEVQEDRAFESDLGVDSLSFVELVMELEDSLGVELPEQLAAGASTVGALVDPIVARSP